MAKSSKGVQICVVKSGATGTALAATAVTKANPAVVTVADVTGLVNGSLIKFAADSTGLETLDGKTFVIDNIDGTLNTFEVVGADTTADTGTFTAGTDFTVYGAAACQTLCFSEFSFNREEPSTIATGTYCKPQDSIASAATSAGTVSFAGYIDKSDAGYKMLIDAVEGDTTPEFDLKITFPENGYIIVPITFDSINWDIPLDGALGFSGTGTMKANPRHLF